MRRGTQGPIREDQLRPSHMTGGEGVDGRLARSDPPGPGNGRDQPGLQGLHLGSRPRGPGRQAQLAPCPGWGGRAA